MKINYCTCGLPYEESNPTEMCFVCFLEHLGNTRQEAIVLSLEHQLTLPDNKYLENLTY